MFESSRELVKYRANAPDIVWCFLDCIVFLVSLVFQAYIPSGTPGRFTTGNIPVWAPSWLLFGFVPVFRRHGRRFFGRGSNFRYNFLI